MEQTIVRIYTLDGSFKTDVFIPEDSKHIITLAGILDKVKLKILEQERTRMKKELAREATLVGTIRKLLFNEGTKSKAMDKMYSIMDNLIQTEHIGSELFTAMMKLNTKLEKLPIEDKKRLLKDVTSTIENVIGGG